jgi:spoIIIJ-associated protein
MGSERRIEVEGRTLKEAVDHACEMLGIKVFDLEYKLNADHFRGGADTVKIVAWRKDNRELELGERTREYLSRLLELMGISANLEIVSDEESIRAILITEDSSLIIGKGGQTLDSLQHIVNKALVKYKSDKRIVLDLENYREKREHNLRFVAQKICEKVIQERCTVTLKPMNAYDRRLVHMEVTRYPELGSRSIGDGQMKRLQIFVIGKPE